MTKASGSLVEVVFTYQGVKKTVRLALGSPYLDVIYEVGPSTQYIKNGYSPGLVDLLWNAQMDRVWVSDVAYIGQRNPNNGATAALVLGGGGAGIGRKRGARPRCCLTAPRSPAQKEEQVCTRSIRTSSNGSSPCSTILGVTARRSSRCSRDGRPGARLLIGSMTPPRSW